MCKKYEADIHQFRTDTLLSDGLKPTITHLTNSEAAFLRSHLDGNFVLIAGNNFFSVFPQNNSLLPTSLDMVLNETHFPLFFFFLSFATWSQNVMSWSFYLAAQITTLVFFGVFQTFLFLSIISQFFKYLQKAFCILSFIKLIYHIKF